MLMTTVFPRSSFDMGAFDELVYPVQKWIRAQGWHELREIQARAVHAIIDQQNDLIIAASTAGGKTEAAFLPLISQVIDKGENTGAGFDILYIGPLKALINDQHQRLKEICQDTELSVVPWHGDVSSSIKSKAQKNPKGILLITPESLEALFVRKGTLIPHLFGGTTAVVIDELHTFLDTERGVQLRSLLTRLELATGRRIRRIGLSATLGDMGMARSYLRPGQPDTVKLLEANGPEQELKIQLRGYISGNNNLDTASTTGAVSAHLFKHLRGSQNLIFAGARNNVEIYADRLRVMCEDEHLPQEFYPHHASLSRDHREFVEQRLKDHRFPTTAVCTSTLELGIDIGDVACVAQIGAPFTVASLRQRLGRSGRREGQSAILRQYLIETSLEAKSNFADQLRLGLIRAIAMTELLLKGWCEAPRDQALHLSTLVHQILSVIAERGGASAQRIYVTLCQKGPFTTVDMPTFISVLRRLGEPNVDLIEQSKDGMILLGKSGEHLVEHYSFFAVFKTPEEYRLTSKGKELGTLPIENILAPGMTIIFSGRRWEIKELDDLEKIIQVIPSKAGKAPVFGGDPGDIADCVIQKMRTVLSGDEIPIYLDKIAVKLLMEARSNFSRMGFDRTSYIEISNESFILATWMGSVRTATLALALQSYGFQVQSYDGFLEVHKKDSTTNLLDALQLISQGNSKNILNDGTNLHFEKFHSFLNIELLHMDAISSRLDIPALNQMATEIIS